MASPNHDTNHRHNDIHTHTNGNCHPILSTPYEQQEGEEGEEWEEIITNKNKKQKLLFITESEIELEFSHHDPLIARINNGSFGSCPESILSAQRRFQLLFLRQPDHFYFNTLQPSILRSRSLLASLLNAPHVDHISLVDNATTAAAIVLQSLSSSFSPGDAALLLHYAYGAVKKSVHHYIYGARGRLVEVDLPFPVSSKDQIISSFRKALESAKKSARVRLAVIDHVTSMPSVVIPVKDLVWICREEGVDHVFVDAAHGIGCVDVDVQAIGADFYTSNLHKWLFCPPSVAFLYHRHCTLHHPVVSHEYGNGLPIESAWIGTRDYSAQLVVPEMLEFLERFPGGIEGIKKRNHDKVVEMGQMLAHAWGTHLGCPPDMCSSMVMVGLPKCLGIGSDSDGLKLRTHLRDKFGVEVPIYFRPPKEEDVGEVFTAYARISHQVYNKNEDYYRFRDAVNQLVNDGFTCASLP